MFYVILKTRTGAHEPVQVPESMEGKTAIETTANLLTAMVEMQRELPERLRGVFPAPLTIEVEEVAA